MRGAVFVCVEAITLQHGSGSVNLGSEASLSCQA
jgi:hypothetical protein